MSPYFHPAIIHKARDLWAQSPLFLDTETTGLGEKSEIIEICIVDHEGNQLMDRLVRPRLPIPAEAVSIHGITNTMVQMEHGWREIWPEIESILNGNNVGIYNVDFDLKMMQQSHRLNGMMWKSPDCFFFDVMKMYADFAGLSKWQRLEQAARQCGIIPSATHRAHQDTLLARSIFVYMLQL